MKASWKADGSTGEVKFVPHLQYEEPAEESPFVTLTGFWQEDEVMKFSLLDLLLDLGFEGAKIQALLS